MRASIAKNTISYMVLAWLTGFSILFALTETLGFSYHPLLVAGMIIVMLLLFYTVTVNKKTLIYTLVFIIFILMLFFTRMLFSEGPGVKGINDFLIWINEYLNESADIVSNYAFLMTLITGMIIAFFIYIFTLKKFSFYIIFTGGVSFFVIQWMFDFFVSYIAFYVFLVCVVVYYLLHIYKARFKSENYHDVPVRSFITYACAFSILIVVISLLLPHNDGPIMWPWMDRKVDRIVDFINGESGQDSKNFISFDRFTLSSSGFSRADNDLGGRIVLDDTHVLTVESAERAYLKGAINNFYSGRSWTNKITESNLQAFENVETLEGIKILIEESSLDNNNSGKDEIIESIVSKKEMSITYKNIRTSSVFIPAKTDTINFLKKKGQIKKDYAEMYESSEKLSKNTNYSLEYYHFDASNEKLVELLKKSKSVLYFIKYPEFMNALNDSAASAENRFDHSYTPEKIQKLPQFSDEYEILKVPDFLGFSYLLLKKPYSRPPEIGYENLLKLMINSSFNNNEDLYLNIPPTLPQRVKDLAKDITNSKDNKYDAVKAVEEYLSSTFPYTLDTPETPEGRDFVDYFLFDLKKGYCVYYASAMAILLRCVGIPTRYAEGYILPPSPEKNTGTYKVTNKQAHAWVEVYFEGFGWVPFEPTAPFVSSFYRRTYNVASYEESFFNDPRYNDYLEYMEEYDSIPVNIDLPLTTNTEKVNDFNYGLVILIFSLLLITAFAFFILYNAFIQKIRFYLLKNSSPRKTIQHMFQYVMRLFSIQGHSIKAGETPWEYFQRINNYFLYIPDLDFQPNTNFLEIMDTFLTARYSNKNMAEIDAGSISHFVRYLQKDTRKTLGFFKYIWFKFMRGKI